MSRHIHALLVDDEPPARQRLRALLAAEPDVTVAGEAGTVAGAAAFLAGPHRVDVVFLDVRMPGADGFALVDQLADHDTARAPAVVFVTAYAEHAVRAFGVRALDYLLKPFDRQRLAQTLARVREQLPEPAPAPAPLPRLPVEAGSRIRLLELERIEYLRAEGNYVRVHTVDGSYLVRDSLTGLAARLPSDQFCRVHRSLVVRLGGVREVEVLGHGELALRLRGGATVVSGRRYRDQVRQRLGLSG